MTLFCCPPLLVQCLLLSCLFVAVAGDEIPKSRRDRFPSVEERVRVYMSNWYDPPCLGEEIEYSKMMNTTRMVKRDKKGRLRKPEPISHYYSIQVDNLTLGIDIKPDTLLWMNQDVILDCARPQPEEDENDDSNKKKDMPLVQNMGRIYFRQNMRMYCHDVVEMLAITATPSHIQPTNNNTRQAPLLVQFGDMKKSHDFGFIQIPHFKKFRSAKTPEALEQKDKKATCYSRTGRPPLVTVHSTDLFQPIVWKLATHRHYKHLAAVYYNDSPWKQKINKAIWRGQLTGAAEGFDKDLTDAENCHNMWRCRLVHRHATSPWIDAKLTTTRGRLPEILDGVQLVGKKITIRNLMEFKGIIMLEGNDVASGLKWSMLSQSVVLMPPPRHTSWAMEELLEPWVHYVPLKQDASDVEEKMEWVANHDDKAKKIAERATLWIEDLIFHPDALYEERLIKEEMLRRYQSHFIPAPE